MVEMKNTKNWATLNSERINYGKNWNFVDKFVLFNMAYKIKYRKIFIYHFVWLIYLTQHTIDILYKNTSTSYNTIQKIFVYVILH
jgi:hypothetical protein